MNDSANASASKIASTDHTISYFLPYLGITPNSVEAAFREIDTALDHLSAALVLQHAA